MEARRHNTHAAPGVGSGEGATPPPTEVPARPKRRTYTAKYKQAILREVERARDDAQIGAILRREGLYSSHLTTWRRQAEVGALSALSQRRGRKPSRNPLADRVAQLERENQRLHKRLEQAEIIIDVQKKVSALLGIPLNAPPSDEDG